MSSPIRVTSADRAPRVGGWAGGALASAAGAALAWFCCLPLAAGGAGTMAAVLATTMGPFRPHLTTLAVALLGMAFWQAYRPRKSECGADRSCQASPGRRRRLIALWLTALLVAALLTVERWSSELIFRLL